MSLPGVGFFKRRRPNFDEAEIIALFKAVKANRSILAGKFDRLVTNKTKNIAWESVARHVNLVSNVHRDSAEVRKKFSDYRAIVKKKVVNLRSQRLASGTGKSIFN